MLTRRTFLYSALAFGFLLAQPLPLHAAPSTEEEIYALIRAVETCGCQFIRNGDSHTAIAAAEHLRLKYRKGKSYAPTAEAFIENLASKSSRTKTPYYLQTPNGEKTPSGPWLRARLIQMRSEASARTTSSSNR